MKIIFNTERLHKKIVHALVPGVYYVIFLDKNIKIKFYLSKLIYFQNYSEVNNT